jgi:predicted transcriptional regulator
VPSRLGTEQHVSQLCRHWTERCPPGDCDNIYRAFMFKALWNSRWRRADDPLRAALGHLEREVMEVVWAHERLTVREVQGLLSRRVAYTTVMTTLDRLFKKGFVARTRVGRAFVYAPAQTRHQTEAAVASGLVSGFFSGGAAMPILSNLVDAVGSQDGGVDLLNALEEMVRDKRRRIEEGAAPSEIKKKA